MIECRELGFGYEEQLLLKGVNLKWQPGELNLLLGRNGVGKSTFLRLLTQLLVAKEGSVSWNGEIKADFNKLISLIEAPQLPVSLTPKQFLKENLSWYKHARINEIEIELDMWGVNSNKKMGQLSQGNLQKVQILRCFLSGCSYVIFDEPTAHLDPSQVHYFWSKIREYQGRGISFFVSSHHLSEMFLPRSQVYLMHNGAIDKVEANKAWTWRILWKNLSKDHYCDEEFYQGTMEECNIYLAEQIREGRQLLQMVAADWEVVGEELVNEASL